MGLFLVVTGECVCFGEVFGEVFNFFFGAEEVCLVLCYVLHHVGVCVHHRAGILLGYVFGFGALCHMGMMCLLGF
jgi:hypothetical protein